MTGRGSVAPSVPEEVPTAIQKLLSAHGFYSPIELLLATNRLGYDDYQAWRRGDHETLDDSLPDGAAAVRALLDQAAEWARGLHLDAGRVPLFGTDARASVELKASADARLDELLQTEYRRDVDRGQPDLFLDGTELEVQKHLIDAIVARDASRSGEKLRQLTVLHAHHWAVSHATLLIDALAVGPLHDAGQARQRLDALENLWLPAASALLRADARDFLIPLWRDVGRALEGVPFQPADPRSHASWAYLNGLDWENLKRTILEVRNWRSEPILQVRLGTALWWLRDQRGAIRTWCALCWQAPAHFAECIESAGFPDAALRRAWDRARDQDFDPPITATWFPAWLAIENPGIATAMGPCGGATDPERAFDHLIALRRGHTDREDIEHRRALQDLHGDLLGHYLASLDA